MSALRNVLRRRSWRGFNRRPAALIGLGIICLGGLSIGQGVYMNSKALLAQILLHNAWAETQAGQQAVKPWGWADTWPVAKISVPRLDRSQIVLSGFSGQALAFAPGLLDQGAYPGEPGLAVIAAHRDTHFEFLQDIKLGDRVEVTNTAGEAIVFEITETQIVRADASGLTLNGSTPRLALVTCYPFNAITPGEQRFVAIGELRGDAS